MGTKPPELEADEDARILHAVQVHGLREEPCPTCKGADSLCTRCDGAGVVFFMTHTGRCGPDCPLRSDA